MPRRWRGVLCIEGTQTGDGRVMAEGAIEWPDPPLPLGLLETEFHDYSGEGGPQIGVIESLQRVGNEIIGEGIFDETIPEAAEVIRRLEEGTAPSGNRWGVSIDPDNWEVEVILTDAEEEEVILIASGDGAMRLRAAAGDPDPGEGGGDEGVVIFEDRVDTILERYTMLRIRGATLCSFPAFTEAYVELVGDEAASASPEEPPAATTAAAAPVRPPSVWFHEPEPLDGDERLVQQVDGAWACPLTITDDGQVYGHLARAGQSHRGYSGARVTPPRSSTGYREFHTGVVVCDDGTSVNVGPLVVAADHAPLSMSTAETRDHYANSGLGWADVRAIDGRMGPWISGALRPGVTDEDLRVLRALSLSGDWRGPSASRLELIAALAVNSPGFPIARDALAASSLSCVGEACTPRVHMADGEQTALVAAGVVQRCPDCAERARLASAVDQVSAMGEVLEQAIAPFRRELTRMVNRLALKALSEDEWAVFEARMRPPSENSPA